MIKKIIISFLIFVSFSSVVFAQPYKIYKGNEVRLSDRIELKKMFIDSFSIDGTFSSSADTKLSSSLAIKTYVDSQVSASTKWVTDANGINSDGANIGINTDASATRAINSIGDVTFRLGSLNNAWFKDSTTAYNIASIWGTGTDGNISILSNTDENIRFSANGNSFILNDNFGLGVLSPTERLEVDGNITGTNIDLTNAISIGSSYGSAGYLLTSNNGGVMTWTDPASLGGGGVSDTLFQITNASNLAGIASPIQNDIAINATSDTIWIYDDTGIWTVSFSGGGGGYWTQTGNYVYPTTLTDLIGIGTATPESELHVKSNSLEPITITLNDSGDRPSIRMKSEFANTSGYAVNFFRHTMSNTVTEIEAGHIGAFGQMRADPLLPTLTYMYLGAEETVAYNNNTLRLYPDKTAYFDGNVGIGTTTPTATLHVQGSDALATSDALIVQNSALTDLFHIQNDGKIGIGKVTPTYPVDIEAADDIMLQMKSTDANMWMSLKDATTADFIGFGAKGNNIHFRTDLGDIIFAADAVGGEVERMRLKNTGQLQLLDYGGGTVTGTMTELLGVDVNGDIIEPTPTEVGTWLGGLGGLWTQTGNFLHPTTSGDSVAINTTIPRDHFYVEGNTNQPASMTLGNPSNGISGEEVLATINFHTDDSGVDRYPVSIVGIADNSHSLSSATSSLLIRTESGLTGLKDRLRIKGNGDIESYLADGLTIGKHWDSTDGRLGIGTEIPQAHLDITKDLAGGSASLLVKNTDNTNINSHVKVQMIGGGTSGGEVNVYYQRGETNKWSTGIDNDGSEAYSIGYGNNMNDDKLRIFDTGKWQGKDYGIGGITGTMAYGLGFEADGSVIEVTPSEFNTWQGNWLRNGGDLYMANTTDSVGIGTTNPTEILHIYSAANATMLFESTNNSAVKVKSINASPSSTLQFHSALAGETSMDAGKGLGAVKFYGFRDFDNTYALSAGITAGANEDFTGAGVGSYIAFSTAQNGFAAPAEHMRLHERGYLGINRTAPTAAIHARGYGAGATTDAMIIQNSSDVVLFQIENAGDIGIGTSDPDVMLDIESATTADMSIGDATKRWTFSHATADGNLVLSTSADDDFEIHSSGGVFSKFSAFNGDFQTYTTQIHNGTTWKNALKNSSTGNALQVGSTTAADWANVYIPDNVGINILAPATANLHIAENSSAASQIRLTNDDTGHTATDGLEVGVSSTGSIAIINNRENDDLNLATNNTVRLSIQEDGDIGIGTSSPTSELEVVGNFELSGNIILDITNNIIIATGSGTPEAVLTAGIGSTYHRSDGGTGTSFYVKESGTGNTGWVAK